MADAGRHSLYTPEMQAKADDYLLNWSKTGDKIPSVVGLACELGVSKKTLYNWGDVNPIFLHTLESIQAAQERESLSKGLDGTFNSTITKLVLANHGYSDKTEVDNKSSDGSMTPPQVIERYVVAPTQQEVK